MQVVFNTNGTGYWSDVAKAVRITDMRLGYVSDDKDFGELRVYFNTQTWDVNTDGLIYTDKQFMQELRKALNAAGFAGADVDYSEQGMQGEDFVSMDVGADFIRECEALYRFTINQEAVNT